MRRYFVTKNTFKYSFSNKGYSFSNSELKDIQPKKEDIPEDLDKVIGDTTTETRSYAYGQGSSRFVKEAENKILGEKVTDKAKKQPNMGINIKVNLDEDIAALKEDLNHRHEKGQKIASPENKTKDFPHGLDKI
jgi:hypothetical protein